jgi:hypothetical protein
MNGIVVGECLNFNGILITTFACQSKKDTLALSYSSKSENP